MDAKTLHRNEFIFAGIVIAALLLWAYLHRLQEAQSVPGNAPTVTPAQSVYFSIPGSNNSYGPVNFPQAVYNIPTGPSDGVYNPSSCSCGCSGGGATTYSFPDMSGLFSTLQNELIASDQALANSITSSLPYAEQVFVTNNTPTPFGS